MKNIIDAGYFQELAGKNPEDVCRRALCRYDDHEGCYTLSVWGDDWNVYPVKSKIMRRGNGESKIHPFLSLFVVHYLLTSKDIPMSGEWISEKDIPGGMAFFQGPHAIPTHFIENRFGADLNAFSNICEKLDGVPLEMADRAYSFSITPRVPVAVLLWKSDDEFSAGSKILFDKTIGVHLALDIIFALAVEVCTRVAGISMKGIEGR